MPNNYINSLSTKYGISKSELENIWNKSEKAVDKSKYGDDYYAVVMTVFKKAINANFGLHESLFSGMNFKQYYLYEEEINNYEEDNI